MRFRSFSINNRAPISLFSADDLSDVVVIGGRNGVGKTALLDALLEALESVGGGPLGIPVGSGESPPWLTATIEATCPDERESWGKDMINLPSDASLLASTLRTRTPVGAWHGGIAKIESDRRLPDNLSGFNFSWDLTDPLAEPANINRQSLTARFQDTVHTMFRMVAHNLLSQGNKALGLKRSGENSMPLEFDDPLKPFAEAFALLLSPKELDETSFTGSEHTL